MANMAVVSRILASCVASLALLQGGPVAAQSAVDFSVSGNSTIRGWTCTVTGTATVTEGSSTPAPGFDDGVQAVTLTVPVAAFDCPQDEMKEHLLAALRPEEFPEITFRLEGYEVGRQGAATTGQLTILDATREVSFPLSLSPTGAGVRIEGELPLDMTDYGVEPPEVMLGLMVVRPAIRIQISGIIAR
jgi:polyisoprenoid-binding protein YceI